MRVSGALAKLFSGQRGRVSRDENGVCVGVVVFGNMCFACAVEWDSSLEGAERIKVK